MAARVHPGSSSVSPGSAPGEPGGLSPRTFHGCSPGAAACGLGEGRDGGGFLHPGSCVSQDATTGDGSRRTARFAVGRAVTSGQPRRRMGCPRDEPRQSGHPLRPAAEPGQTGPRAPVVHPSPQRALSGGRIRSSSSPAATRAPIVAR